MNELKSKIQDLIDLDKSTWNVVRFSDIAEHITEKAQPTPEDSERYIGLEHLDSGSIHIRRWGTPIRLKGEKLRMKNGDIIFGKRNAYLKRAAVAPFDGICSAHAMVLRAKPDVIDLSFFPFFLNSNYFMNRAIAISVGSLSPTINWKTLAKEEFKIPPMEMQKKLATLLWAVDETEEKYLKSKDRTVSLRRAIFDELTSKKTSLKCLGDCLLLSKTKSVPPHNEEKYIGLEHVDSGAFSTDKFVSSKSVASVCNVFKKSHLLYSKLRPNLDKAVIATFNGVCTTELLVYEAKKDISLEYILHHLHSDKFVAYAISQGFGTKMPRISHKILSDFKIYAPDHEEQLAILNKLTKIRTTEMDLLKSFYSTRELRDNLINSIF